jgi:hypothetical protein
LNENRMFNGAVHGNSTQSFGFAHPYGGLIMKAIAPGSILLSFVSTK